MSTDHAGVADEYRRLQDEMNNLHDGNRLRDAVKDVLGRLGTGPLALFSTSDQGAGLAAACAAAREDDTVWQKIHLAYPPKPPDGYRVVVVEALPGGAAWLDAIATVYPDAPVIAAATAVPLPALAA
jgi:hypothetical protein